MSEFYDKNKSPREAQDYAQSAETFKRIAIILGSIGVLIALAMLLVGIFTIAGSGLGTIVGATGLAIQSIILIVIGEMMYGLSRVTLATFDMMAKQTND